MEKDNIDKLSTRPSEAECQKIRSKTWLGVKEQENTSPNSKYPFSGTEGKKRNLFAWISAGLGANNVLQTRNGLVTTEA